MPTIHRSWDLLREKLVKIDYRGVEKRVGANKTIVFEVEPLEWDPEIPLISDHKIKKWIMLKDNVAESPVQPPPPKQIKTTIKLNLPFGPKASCSSAVANATDHAHTASSSCTSTKATTTSTTLTTSASSSKTKLRKPLVKSRPKNKRVQREPSPQLSEPSQESSPSPAKGPKPTSSKAQTSPSQRYSFHLNLSEDESCASNNTEDSVRTTTAVCVGSVDALVLNEPIDDEYAMYADDDDNEEESEMSKNLKKIRTPNPPPKPQPRPTIISTPPKKNQRNPVQIHESPPSPPPAPVSPPKPLEPNWPETQKFLQENHFINVLKDFDYFKSHLLSSDVARSLLKEATTKCVLEDETHILLDLLNLMYENDFNSDCDFWSEIIQRLMRKVSSHGRIRKYKSKTSPDVVYENYRRAIKSINGFTSSNNVTLKLPYLVYKFLLDFNDCDQNQIPPSSVPSDINSASSNNSLPNETNPVLNNANPLPNNANQVPNNTNQMPIYDKPVTYNTNSVGGDTNPEAAAPSDTVSLKLEPLPPITTFNVKLPDIKPVAKIEKQENVDPAIERKITLIKNSKGQACFKIIRRKSSKPPVFKHRLL